MVSITKQGFENLVLEACTSDADFRHEIERKQLYGAYADAAAIAYELFRRNFLSLREAFGLTEKR